MKLFERKLDEEKDSIYISFCIEDMQYAYFNTSREKISYKTLSKKCRKKLDLNNKALQLNPNYLQQLIEKEKYKERASFLEAKGFPCQSIQSLEKGNGTISKEIAHYLNMLTSKENVLIGIHRVKHFTSYKDIQDVLCNGLILTAHMEMGLFSSDVKLENNVSYYEDNKQIITELTNLKAFKDSIGAILIEIPDAELDEHIYIIDENGLKRLHPKYILGYLPVEGNHISKLVTAQQMTTYIQENNDREIKAPRYILWSEQEIEFEQKKHKR